MKPSHSIRFEKRIALLVVGALGLALLATLPASAGIFNDQLGLAWASRRDLTSAQFAARFAEYRDRGYIITDVDAYPNGSGLLYSMIWQDNTDGRGWAEWRNLTSSEYHDKWLFYRDRGYRPLDVEGYPSGNTIRYAGIWVENRERLSWYSYRGLTGSEYATHFDDKSSRGYRLVDMEAYQTPNGLRYAAIWYENRERISWAQYRDMDRTTYQQRIDDFAAKGYRVIDFESYTVGRVQLYAAIWERTVLEEATGRPVHRLVKEEIAERYGLSSLRAQFETSSLPSNYERAAPYNDAGNGTSYENNSWKVLGGGIEVSAVDLADFGWKTLDGQIVDAATRDNRLWTRVLANQPNGLAWEVRDVGGRRVAEHGGSWSGARSHLRVYRDDGLVIAILSNRRGHDPSGLATSIGDEILNP